MKTMATEIKVSENLVKNSNLTKVLELVKDEVKTKDKGNILGINFKRLGAIITLF